MRWQKSLEETPRTVVRFGRVPMFFSKPMNCSVEILLSTNRLNSESADRISFNAKEIEPNPLWLDAVRAHIRSTSDGVIELTISRAMLRLLVARILSR